MLSRPETFSEAIGENLADSLGSPDSSDSFLYGSRVKRESPFNHQFHSGGVNGFGDHHNPSNQVSACQLFPSFSPYATHHQSHLNPSMSTHHPSSLASNAFASNAYGLSHHAAPTGPHYHHHPHPTPQPIKQPPPPPKLTSGPPTLSSSSDGRLPKPPTLHPMPMTNGAPAASHAFSRQQHLSLTQKQTVPSSNTTTTTTTTRTSLANAPPRSSSNSVAHAPRGSRPAVTPNTSSSSANTGATATTQKRNQAPVPQFDERNPKRRRLNPDLNLSIGSGESTPLQIVPTRVRTTQRMNNGSSSSDSNQENRMSVRSNGGVKLEPNGDMKPLGKQPSFHTTVFPPRDDNSQSLPSVESWTISQVLNWLLTFPHGALCIDNFAQGLVNGYKLANLSEMSLKSMRIANDEHRKSILHQRHILLTRHKKMSSVEQVSYLCYYCDTRCDSSRVLRKHMSAVHNVKLPEKPVVSRSCPNTSTSSKSASRKRSRRTRSHHYSEDTGRWHCPHNNCNKSYASRQALRYHASTKHGITIETGKRGKPSDRPKNKQFPCPLCTEKVYASKQYLKVHVSNVHHTTLNEALLRQPVDPNAPNIKMEEISIRPPADLFHSMPKIEDCSMRRSDSDVSMSDDDDSDEDDSDVGNSSRGEWDDSEPKIRVDQNSSDSDSGLLQCPDCGDVFYSDSFLQEHRSKEHQQ